MLQILVALVILVLLARFFRQALVGLLGFLVIELIIFAYYPALLIKFADLTVSVRRLLP